MRAGGRAGDVWHAARGTRHATHAMRHVHAPCTEYHTPPAMHFTPCAIHRSYTMRHGTMHHAPCNIHHTHTPRSVQWRPCTAHREPNNEHHVHMHPRLTALHARSMHHLRVRVWIIRDGCHAPWHACCGSRSMLYASSNFFAVSAGLLYSTGGDGKNEPRQLSEATSPGSETSQYVPCTRS